MHTKSFYFVLLPCPVLNTCTIRDVSILLIQNNHTKSSPLRFLILYAITFEIMQSLFKVRVIALYIIFFLIYTLNLHAFMYET